MINVTKTYLPDIEKYREYIDQIYSRGQITNSGPLVKELEQRLANYLGVKNIVLVSNGTVALEIAYRALGVKDFAITTPFSFVATTSSLVANGIKPIFVDIDEKTFNINPNKIEEQITPNTTAIVATQVFGNPCDLEAIAKIAEEYRLKIIYDAAHAFDVKYKGESVLNFGDISTLSFHATKLFHTIEGGALITNSDEIAERARFLINFGIKNAEEIPHLGTNAKMNEFEAAMGLCVLDDMDIIFSSRKAIAERYKLKLQDLVQFQEFNHNAEENYSYFPVLFKSEEELLGVQRSLSKQSIFPRRYFYPSLDTLGYIEPKQYMPISRDISRRIMCLPIYYGLEEGVQEQIISIIKGSL
ncbi:DegT/DnrJ/EryC1/StrS family aminotransferase [Francisella noatunensis]|uniref:DegT/DnrJ/EryC1/StrS family aminotransferase n=1 Tax=Francisella noatunensis TaxID=657445 RepID=A0A9Q2KUA6_9GAMM|nr:DegT/DnrJ/EryC1/StrS family aminotransferase [Francisella noatunensis]MBK2028540.1 DegT/DnrJ/EryC1/StrS family aminotransferase [Francisella noatunensis]MBK2034195.1 DegT/DnrJ/EryC1/StrS family aminotransferase [Francisella noatunensis]MBK2048520.1 DegT/DnrJ/EryC1/StrS family aminotransferase [Francisella noatunensis]MBK2050722.1 DegT/DnrJ/EryC1/StrS family aminotransferase [Francisella noatunensis]MBK2051786.1 DegT/DnrJ/EryC1/StrS family aminotransferase [Francisella noatunensis]